MAGLLFTGIVVHTSCSSGVPQSGEYLAVGASVAESGIVDPAVGEVADMHLATFAKYDGYPSARACAECHPRIYDEWSSSAHAYSGISPMFHKFEQTINNLAQGTIAAFCVRCHLPVGTAVGQPRHMTLPERQLDEGPEGRFVEANVALEGVTCIVCHRVSEQYGRVNAQRLIEQGTIFEPMYGSADGSSIDELIEGEDAEEMRRRLQIAKDESEVGSGADSRTPIHAGVHTNPELAKSQFCVSCHQVAVHPGIKLEVVWDQYLDSPSHADGTSCQDCHMGAVPGDWNPDWNNPEDDAKGTGYARHFRAVIGEQPFPNDDEDSMVRHADHSFVGPGYSIAHPGIFPHRVQPARFVAGERSGEEILLSDWLMFDWRAGWGSDEFEDAQEGDFDPFEGVEAAGRDLANHPWRLRENRVEAWQIVLENLYRLGDVPADAVSPDFVAKQWTTPRRERRAAVMEKASSINGPFFDGPLEAGSPLRFHYVVKNECDGHNLPSGSLGAQPQVWLNVALEGPDGGLVWESGWIDSRGDVGDLHSRDVFEGRREHDDQLFNLQSKFLTTNVKGTDREMFLPVNMDVDQIPFIRPAGQPTTLMNHPPFIRMEQFSIPPRVERDAEFTVPAELMTKPGTYRMAVRMRSRAEPIYFMDFVGATEEMVQRMNERMVDIHPYTVEFDVR